MNKKILIYDDDAEILMLCKAILTNYNYHVDTLSRCENILSDIKQYNPGLVLMDLWIPEIGGEKAISIAKNEKDIKIPILIFSANADIKDISAEVNADGYVEKPFTVSHFIETIDKYFSG